MQSILRKAATLLLLRDAPAGGLEVLMVRRDPKAAFGPGAMVFPGGVLDAADGTPEMEACSAGLTMAGAQAAITDAESPAEALGLHVAAIRETFEEIGLLLARTPNGQWWRPENGGASLGALQQTIAETPASFAPWLAQSELALSTGELVYFAYWITPEGLPLRFATRFFMAEYQEEAEIRPDNSEIVGHAWLRPHDALRDDEEGRLHLMDPTRITLQWLTAHQSAAEALAAYRGKDIPPIMPKIIWEEKERKEVLFPWDDGYDEI